MGHYERLGQSVLTAVYTTYTVCVNMYMYHVFGKKKIALQLGALARLIKHLLR